MSDYQPTETADEINERLTTYRRRYELLSEKASRELKEYGWPSEETAQELAEAMSDVSLANAEWIVAKMNEARKNFSNAPPNGG